jgi:LysM repeat protein
MKQNGITQGERPAATPAANAGSPAGNLAQGLPLAASEPVKARAMLSSALLSGELSPLDAKRCSDALVEIGRVLAFTPVYNANDPMFFQYTVQSGDSLEKIVRRHKIGCDWRLVQRINNIKKPEAIRVGQRLKLPKGPFSAVVSKRDYRVDICVGAGNERVVLTSLPCGLGSANGTPTGNFKVRVGSKLLNPEWTHPVTGEHFAGDDPKNPIGEHWLGLEGTDTTNAQLAGYGIHGTIDIDSIGQDRSLGCVRLLAEDVALVWECLGDGAMVEIRP